jgi:hypothetical protein
MPSKKRKDGTNAETRQMMEERVLAEYEKIAGEPVKRRL